MVTTFAPLWNLVKNRRELIQELILQELRNRHQGQLLGILWAFGQPLVLTLIYTFLFAYVFPARTLGLGYQDYSTCILASMIPWLAFQDLLSRSTNIFIGHSNLVKQIIFPIETLPIKTVIACILPYSTGLLFAILYSGWQQHLSWFSLIAVWLIVFQFIAMLGVAFLLSTVGIFWRDLKELVQIFCTLNLFAQPILYNPYQTPSWLKILFYFNPFSYLTWCWQDTLYYGYAFHHAAWAVLPLLCIFILFLGWTLFTRIHYLFGDAL